MPELSEAPQSLQTLRDVLGGPIEIGAPDVSGPLAVFPLFGPPAGFDYTSFSRAHAAGEVRVSEMSGGASVNDLAVENRGKPVLLYEGEELLGAQQNRVLDISLLIGTRRKDGDPGELRRAGTLGRPPPRRGLPALHAGGRSRTPQAQGGPRS